MCLIKPVASKVSKGWYKTMVSDDGFITPTSKLSSTRSIARVQALEMFDDGKNKFTLLTDEKI